TSANNLAITLRTLNRRSEAVDLLKDVFVRSQRVLGANHPDTARVTRNLAAALISTGREYEAQQLTGRKSKNRHRFGRKRR
ncbi:tetratricopeptide repeat protein, partial [Streptomyces sp. NPDC047868]